MRSLVANLLVVGGLAAIVTAAGWYSPAGGLAVGGVVAVLIGCGLIVVGKRIGP